MRVLISGSSGLIGSELVEFFDSQATRVVGLDNNMRADFFGPEGDTTWNLRRLIERTRHFLPPARCDIRDRAAMRRLFRKEGPFDLVVHCAAQPSHDLAASGPFDDFDVNAVGTLNLLEAARRAVARTPSSSHEHEQGLRRRAERAAARGARDPLGLRATRRTAHGIAETMRDRPARKHSLFGASKVAADVMVQEYGRYFGMRTGCLRGGCLTGPNHAASSCTAS